VNGEALLEAQLGYVPPGRDALRIEAEASSRLLLIGGEPLGEQIVMWWNFLGRSHDEIVEARRSWMQEVAAPELADRRYGRIPNDPLPPLPAPELPNVRLRPRS
jgi:hypothetical protein